MRVFRPVISNEVADENCCSRADTQAATEKYSIIRVPPARRNCTVYRVYGIEHNAFACACEYTESCLTRDF